MLRFLLSAPSMGGGLISHTMAFRARAVLFVSDIKAPCFPLLKSAFVRTKTVASKADTDGFL